MSHTARHRAPSAAARRIARIRLTIELIAVLYFGMRAEA